MDNNPVELALFLKSCRTCGADFGSSDGRRTHCSDACVKVAKAAHRRGRQAKYRTGHPVHEFCRQVLKNAINQGTVRRPTRCEQCGDLEFVEGHHADYRRPFFVEWLCKACHAGRGVVPLPELHLRQARG